VQPKQIKINTLSLANFRNSEKASYTFSEGLVFITGLNGAGKTTILEAIGLTSFLKSFRFALDREMIRFGTSFYRAEVGFTAPTGNHRIAISFGRNPEDAKAPVVKKYSLDGRTNERAAAIIGRIPSVVLSPDDLRIVAGDHTERRRFIDLLLSMLYPGYFTALQNYQRALKMRSQLLKSRPDEAVLSAIDRELAGAGTEILLKRRQFIPEFSGPFASSVSKISLGKDSWQLEYQGETKQVETIADYMAMLKEHRANDLRLRQTTSGIHRDRLFFLTNDVASQTSAPVGPNHASSAPVDRGPDIRVVGSQGQKRTAALALKLAQFTYMQEKLGTRPVLLIDDVLNELDLTRRASFVDFLRDVGQVFFTTTDLIGMQDFLKDMGQAATVQNIEL
jgi:DNA replication and repair protein RecF